MSRHDSLKFFNKGSTILAIACMLADPGALRAQSEIQSRLDRELALVEEVEREEVENGPNSAGLIDPLRNLVFYYEEIGDLPMADATIERVLQVIRANEGLYSLGQAPVIRQMIDRELMRDNRRNAWDLEYELLRLAQRNPEDLRAAQVMRAIGDRRMEILREFEDGLIPEEIVWGCYYDDRASVWEATMRGSRPIYAHSPDNRVETPECGSGSRRRARRALISEAQAFYSAAVDIHLANEDYSNPELKSLLDDIVRTSYSYTTPNLGRRSLGYLLAYEASNSNDALPRIEAMVEIADWDLFYTKDFGTNWRDRAYEGYLEALQLLEEQNIPQETIDEIFSPSVPVLLPSHRHNPFSPVSESASGDYIDVAFVVSQDGKSDDVEIVASSPGVERPEERDLVQMIKRNRFRPQLVDGEFADAGPVTVRYYLNN